MAKRRAVKSTGEKFLRHVSVDTDDADACWIWNGARTKGGYGVFARGSGRGNTTNTTAHRIAYELYVGAIPDGYEIDHLCRVKLCVNPAHLEAVTSRENNLRSESTSSRNAHKVACESGHLYAEHGYVNPTTGRRRCRTCSNAKASAHYYRRKGLVPDATA